MSSRSSPITGIRLNPDRSASETACRTVLVRSMYDHLGARHHHLLDDGVAKVEHGVDHPALPGFDHVGRLGEVDQFAQFGLGTERAIGEALARGERVTDQDHHLRDGSQHGGEHRQRTRRGQGHRVGVLPAQGARGDAQQDERHHDHDPDRVQHLLPGGLETSENEHRHHHDGHDLGQDPDEQQGVQGRCGILGDGDQGLGTASSLIKQAMGAALRERCRAASAATRSAATNTQAAATANSSHSMSVNRFLTGLTLGELSRQSTTRHNSSACRGAGELLVAAVAPRHFPLPNMAVP